MPAALALVSQPRSCCLVSSC